MKARANSLASIMEGFEDVHVSELYYCWLHGLRLGFTINLAVQCDPALGGTLKS